MPLLSLRGIHRTIDDRHLLNDVELVIDEGQRLGLVGRNGSGKSTLLRIAAGLEAPDAGERVTARGLRLGLLEQEPQLGDAVTIRDAVRAGLGRREPILQRLAEVHVQLEGTCHDRRQLDALLAEAARLEDELESLGGHAIEHRVEQVVAALGLPSADTPCERLSGGERRRVALARLLLSGPDLLLLDEPTNHLDASSIAWLETWLAEQSLPLLMITHDRYVLDRVCDRILELEDGSLYTSEGGYVGYLEARAERLAAAQHAEQARLNLLRRETAWMRRGPPARTTKAKARIQRHGELVEDAPRPSADDLLLAIPPGPRLGTKVLRLDGVTLSRGGRTLFADLDLEIGPGERLGLLGPNGAGKSSLLALCMGALTPDRGSVTVGETVRFARIDQQRSELDDEATVLQEVAGDGTEVAVGERRLRVESFLERFLFKGGAKFTPVGQLSGGERNRVLLAKLLLAGGNVLILDEPTNDLDLSTLGALEEALLAFEGSALIVSHDRAFLDRVATQLLLLDGQGGQRLDRGTVAEVLARHRQRAEAEGAGAERGKRTKSTSTAASRPPAPTPAGSNAPRRLSNWEHAELERLPDSIEELERRVAVLAERLADPGLYTGPLAARQTVEAEHSQLVDELTAQMTRWEELEERRLASEG